MTLTRRGSAKQKHEARRAWLSAHPELYRDVPGINEDVSDAGRLKLDALYGQMVALRLFGASSVENKREAIRRLVSELRGEPVGGGEW
jgi:hypothetical protein